MYTNAKPIIFSTEMVRAILDNRKTQTRRVIKPQPKCTYPRDCGCTLWNYGKIQKVCLKGTGFCMGLEMPKPKYQPGDILWVRETWGVPIKMAGNIIYKADYASGKAPLADGEKWRSPRFMPREAARIFLRVTNVRVERLQDITKDDALAEGVWLNEQPPKIFHKIYGASMPVHLFGGYWDYLNAKRGYGWETNPWVQAIEFEKVSRKGGEANGR